MNNQRCAMALKFHLLLCVLVCAPFAVTADVSSPNDMLISAVARGDSSGIESAVKAK